MTQFVIENAPHFDSMTKKRSTQNDVSIGNETYGVNIFGNRTSSSCNAFVDKYSVIRKRYTFYYRYIYQWQR